MDAVRTYRLLVFCLKCNVLLENFTYLRIVRVYTAHYAVAVFSVLGICNVRIVWQVTLDTTTSNG
jgi:hypothetical protein